MSRELDPTCSRFGLGILPSGTEPKRQSKERSSASLSIVTNSRESDDYREESYIDGGIERDE